MKNYLLIYLGYLIEKNINQYLKNFNNFPVIFLFI